MWLIVALIQVGMVACITYLIITKADAEDHAEIGVYPLVSSTELYLLVLKVLVSMILHIMIVPEIVQGMDMLKYVIN